MERMLFERERPLFRMDELAQAARAMLNPLFVPSLGEQGAPGQELLGEPAARAGSNWSIARSWYSPAL